MKRLIRLYNKAMNTDSNCIFCKIVAGEIPSNKVWEDEDFVAFLDIKPNNLGHTLLVPKAHYKNIFDLPDNLLDKLGKRIQLVAKAVLAGAEAAGINVTMNNGETAGQLIWHAHIHLIPRYQGDGIKPWTQKENFSPDDFQEMTRKIKQAM